LRRSRTFAPQRYDCIFGGSTLQVREHGRGPGRSEVARHPNDVCVRSSIHCGRLIPRVRAGRVPDLRPLICRGLWARMRPLASQQFENAESPGTRAPPVAPTRFSPRGPSAALRGSGNRLTEHHPATARRPCEPRCCSRSAPKRPETVEPRRVHFLVENSSSHKLLKRGETDRLAGSPLVHSRADQAVFFPTPPYLEDAG